MVTRRALLGAGAVALLAGCGPPEEPKIVPAEVLDEQHRLSLDVASAYNGVEGVDELRRNALGRVRRLEAALKRLGAPLGGPRREPATGLQAALAAESAALRAHVAAVGLLADREWRELLGGLVADAAAGEAALRERLQRPDVTTSFPGQPVA